jgi:hypothetical protein
MRAEAALRNGSEALVENAVSDLAHGAVLIQVEDRDLSVMETGDKDIVVGFAC